MSQRDILRDIDTEAALLGACLASTQAIDDVRGSVAASDFAAGRHQATWQAICAELDAHGDVDLLGVAARLDEPEIHLWLRELMIDTPAISAAPSYAARIVDMTARRGLIFAADEITKLAQNTGEPAGEAIDRAQHLLASVDMPIPDAAPDPDIDSFLGDVDDRYDWLIPGFLERRDRFLLTAGEGVGKALSVDTPVPTPTGWTTMGKIKPGDIVFSNTGQPVEVVSATAPWHGDCYRVKFDDGTMIIADAGHLWLTETLRAREAEAQERRRDATKPRGTDQRWKRKDYPEVVTTAHIRDTLTARGGHSVNHSIDTTTAVNPEPADLPISPYTFGAWLGDGNSRTSGITCADPEILDHIRAEGWTVVETYGQYQHRITGKPMRQGLEAQCRKLGVHMNKHIPTQYLRASADQRLAVLQGLMDTDGTVGKHSRCELTLTNERLAADALELILSLGFKARMVQSDAKLNGRTVSQRWRIGFNADDSRPVFKLARKLERQLPARTRRGTLRYIVAVDPVPSVPVRCIQVANPDGMFLAGREFIPTHNSVLLAQIGVMAAAGIHPWTRKNIEPRNVAIVDLENGPRLLKRRIGAMRGVAGGKLDPGRLRIAAHPDGIDLTTRSGRRWLLERCTANQTDLLVIGPAYRLMAGTPERGDIGGEDMTRKVTAALDEVRNRCNVTLLMETHAPHGDGFGRNLRPFGSSVWLRWPEFGLGIARNRDDPQGIYQFTRWRGDRDERQWPKRLKRTGMTGRDWPWQALDYDDRWHSTGSDMPEGAIT